jgi:mono/diheme cytochrome c family protein
MIQQKAGSFVRSLQVWIVLIPLFVVGIAIGLTLDVMSHSVPFTVPTLSSSALTATALCFVPTTVGGRYAAIYDLFGTLTPTPLPPGVTLTPTAEPTSVALAGNPKAGARLFYSTTANCSSCHSVEDFQTVVGPSLKGIAMRAAYKRDDLSAADYIRGVIRNPATALLPNPVRGIMPITYAEKLTDQQIEDLVAYLLTLQQ